MSDFDDIFDAISALEELRVDVDDRITKAIELLGRMIQGPGDEPDPVQTVAVGLDGEVKEQATTPLPWYPAPEHIAQVRDRFEHVVTDDRLRDLTARFIRWHESKGETLPYPGASQRWYHWACKEAQRIFEESLAQTGMGDVVSAAAHHRPTPQDRADLADDARARAEEAESRRLDEKHPEKPWEEA